MISVNQTTDMFSTCLTCCKAGTHGDELVAAERLPERKSFGVAVQEQKLALAVVVGEIPIGSVAMSQMAIESVATVAQIVGHPEPLAEPSKPELGKQEPGKPELHNLGHHMLELRKLELRKLELQPQPRRSCGWQVLLR